MTEPNLEAPIEPQTPPVEGSIEERARRMGWRPEDEYNGPKGRWVDAQTFVDRGETELPILRERFRKLDDRLAATERELTNARGTLVEANTKIKEQSEVLVELRDLSRNAETRAYNRAQSEFVERERKAVAEADTATFDRIQFEKRQLEETRAVAPARREPPAAAPAAPAAPPPAAVAPADATTIGQWIADNPWYNSDPEMNAVATTLHGTFKSQNPNEALNENLGRVRDRMVQLYPEKFGNPRRAAPSAVGSPTAPAPKPKGKTVNDLPPDAKAALAKIKRDIPGYKDEEYIRLYFGSDDQ